MMSSPQLVEALFPERTRKALDALVDLAPGVITDLSTPESWVVLPEVEVLITGWGAPALADEDLDRMPRLRAVIHSGGVARPYLGSAPERRGIVASNSGYFNSIPVAEFTLALIILSGKNALENAAAYRTHQDRMDRTALLWRSGNFRRTVGIVGASRVGRLLIERLAQSSFHILVHDPFLRPAEAAELGVEAVGLDDLLTRADVVSLHVPVLPSTTGMIGPRELRLIRDGATFINTARGAIVDQDALVQELRTGRFTAYLDTTDPEPLPADHELYALPNVFLTPHIAGSLGNELLRLGENVVAETERFVTGQPFAYPEKPPTPATGTK